MQPSERWSFMRSPDVSVGERFVDALLAKDWTRVDSAVDPEIDFRALTPGRAWEATTRKDLVEGVFQHWFGPSVEIYEIVDISTDRVVGRNRVVYRFRLRNPDGDHICEQTAYYDEARGRITNLRILCTGFLPSPDDRVAAIDLMTAEA
jgi:hypothetical protein